MLKLTLLCLLSLVYSTPVVKDGVELPTTLTKAHQQMGRTVLESKNVDFSDCVDAVTEVHYGGRKTKVSCEQRFESAVKGEELLLHEAAFYYYLTGNDGGVVLSVPDNIKTEIKKVCQEELIGKEKGKYQVSSYGGSYSGLVNLTFGSFQCLPQKDGGYIVRDIYKVDAKRDGKSDLVEGGSIAKEAASLLGGNDYHFVIKID